MEKTEDGFRLELNSAPGHFEGEVTGQTGTALSSRNRDEVEGDQQVRQTQEAGPPTPVLSSD